MIVKNFKYPFYFGKKMNFCFMPIVENAYLPFETKLPDNCIYLKYVNLNGANFKKIPKNSIFLEYLDVRHTDVDEIPESTLFLGRLKIPKKLKVHLAKSAR